MKNTRFMVLIAACSFMMNAMAIIVPAKMIVEPVNLVDLYRERNVFVKAWMAEYLHCSHADLGVQDIQRFLHTTFDQEVLDCAKQKKGTFFVHAMMEDKLVGYLSFQVDEYRAVYVRQWALLPEFATEDNMADLLFAVFDYVPNASCLYLAVRDVAHTSIKHISKIGFEMADEQPEGFDLELYSCYKIMAADKCGTCFCGCDEADLAADMLGCGCGDDGKLAMECCCGDSYTSKSVCGVCNSSDSDSGSDYWRKRAAKTRDCGCGDNSGTSDTSGTDCGFGDGGAGFCGALDGGLVSEKIVKQPRMTWCSACNMKYKAGTVCPCQQVVMSDTTDSGNGCGWCGDSNTSDTSGTGYCRTCSAKTRGCGCGDDSGTSDTSDTGCGWCDDSGTSDTSGTGCGS